MIYLFESLKSKITYRIKSNLEIFRQNSLTELRELSTNNLT